MAFLCSKIHNANYEKSNQIEADLQFTYKMYTYFYILIIHVL